MNEVKKRKTLAIICSSGLIALLAILMIYSFTYQQYLPDDSHSILDNVVKSGNAYDVTFTHGDEEYKILTQLDYDNEILKCIIINKEDENEYTQLYIDSKNEEYYSINSGKLSELYCTTYTTKDNIVICTGEDYMSNTVEGDLKKNIETSIVAARLALNTDEPVTALVALGNIFNKLGIDIVFDDLVPGKADIVKANKDNTFVKFQ